MRWICVAAGRMGVKLGRVLEYRDTKDYLERQITADPLILTKLYVLNYEDETQVENKKKKGYTRPT